MERNDGQADGLADALTRFWETEERLGGGKDAFVNARSSCEGASVSHKSLRRWMLRVRDQIALETETKKSRVWLVVGIAVALWSAQESALMLLVSEHPEWIYVPIDISLPVSRQLEMMKVARVDHVVTLPGTLLAKTLLKDPDAEMTVLPLQEEDLKGAGFRDVCVFQLNCDVADSLVALVREGMNRASNGDTNEVTAPLYVLFTSGSTGHPKGVLGTRSGAWERVKWMWKRFPFDINHERVARTVKLSFVDSVWEILGAFLQRVPLVHFTDYVAYQDDQVDAKSVSHAMLDESSQFLVQVSMNGVTRFTAVPSVFDAMIARTTEFETALIKLRYLLFSGEALSFTLAQKITNVLPHVVVLNLYGCTEVAGDVTYAEISPPLLRNNSDNWRAIGVPVGTIGDNVGSDTNLLLSDESGNIVALLVGDTTQDSGQRFEGELWVSGPPVALGYVSLKNGLKLLTGQESPFQDNQNLRSSNCHARNWFKTGDICTVVGNFIYLLGRKDRLIKIRGQRVQLDAVERLVSQGLVHIDDDKHHDCQVVAFDTKTTTIHSFTHHQLVVCIVDTHKNSNKSRSEDDLGKISPFVLYRRTEELNRWIVDTYGSAYVPNVVYKVRSSAFKRLPNGKIDRRGLASFFAQGIASPASESRRGVPSNNVKAFIRHVMWTVLRIPADQWEVSSSLSFETLGVDSLLATLLHFELRKQFPNFKLTPAKMATLTPLKLIIHLHNTGSIKLLPKSPTELKSASPPAKRRKLFGGDLAQEDSTAAESIVGLLRCNQTSSGKVLISTLRSSVNYLSQTTSLDMALAWRVDLKKCVDASPLVVTNPRRLKCVIIGSHAGLIVCVDLHGKELWSAQLDDRIEASAAFSERFELAFVGTYSGTLYAFEVRTGRIEWTYQCGGMIKATALPIDTLGIVGVGAYDGKLHGISMHEDGSELWTFDVGASIFSAPVTTSDQAKLWCASTGGDIISLVIRKNPEQVWKRKLPAPVFSGLAVDENSDLLVVGCADGNIHGLVASTGELRWAVTTTKPVFSSPCMYESSVIVVGSHDGYLRKINTRAGQVIWSTLLNGAIFSSPAVFRSVTHSTASEGASGGTLLCCVATTVGSVYVIDENTGAIIKCTHNLRAGDLKEPIGEVFSSPVIIENLCLIGTRSNALLAFQL